MGPKPFGLVSFKEEEMRIQTHGGRPGEDFFKPTSLRSLRGD